MFTLPWNDLDLVLYVVSFHPPYRTSDKLLFRPVIETRLLTGIWKTKEKSTKKEEDRRQFIGTEETYDNVLFVTQSSIL